MNVRRIALASALLYAPLAAASASSLKGSPASMVRQHAVAVEEDYSFLRNKSMVEHFVDEGRLIELTGNADYRLADVSYPFARPEVRDFVEHFAVLYHEATGSKLVITSLMRPLAAQPSNAHRLSVHPAGMAVDLRVPADADDRAWLEKTLLGMEKDGLLDVTREHHPPHYHVAVFREQLGPWVAVQDSIAAVKRAVAQAAAEQAAKRAADSLATVQVAQASAVPERGNTAGLLTALLLIGLGVPAARVARKKGSA